MNIFCMPYRAYLKKLKRYYVFIAAIIALCLAVNIALVCMVTDDSKVLFTTLNIVIDFLGFSFAYGFYMVVINEMQKRVRLYSKKDDVGEQVKGLVLEIKGRERIEHFDCTRIKLNVDGMIRIVFAPVGVFEDLIGKSARLVTVNNIAVEAEYVE